MPPTVVCNQLCLLSTSQQLPHTPAFSQWEAKVMLSYILTLSKSIHLGSILRRTLSVPITHGRVLASKG